MNDLLNYTKRKLFRIRKDQEESKIDESKEHDGMKPKKYYEGIHNH